ncbi:hypothetical protein [Aquimarina sp. AU474]|uniref:hypothetical protein n=1 Tax=Aquimarina sp. AU474 TaxID=2108529 RepID=UPI000D68E854|nr:hypothetical protein [Aquimarina sp. AU474]
MKNLIPLFLLIIVSYQCNSQSVEASLYLREELVKQRDDLLKKAQELQVRIDAIDKKLGNKPASTHTVQYLTKSATYNDGSYTRSIEKQSNKQYKSRSTRTYHRGPRGGCYYTNSNGNKTYVARSMCN